MYSGHTRSCGCSKTEFFKDSISQWIENNPEKIKERVTKLRKWHENNPNHSKQISIVNLEKAQQWNKDHPEEKKIFLEKAHKEASIWLKNNKDIIKENFNLWKMEHPEEVIEARRRSLLSRFSNEEKDVYEFLLSLGCNVERQFYVGDHFYDFRIDDFLIEYNGSAYHYSNFEFLDSPNSKEPSICKPKNYHVVVRNNAIIHGFNIIQIWDFDWIHKKEFIKKLIKDQLFHLANYKDYLEGNLLNNDFGFIVEGDFIMSKGKWVSSKYRKVVDSTYTKGRVLVFNSGYTKIFDIEKNTL